MFSTKICSNGMCKFFISSKINETLCPTSFQYPNLILWYIYWSVCCSFQAGNIYVLCPFENKYFTSCIYVWPISYLLWVTRSLQRELIYAVLYRIFGNWYLDTYCFLDILLVSDAFSLLISKKPENATL